MLCIRRTANGDLELCVYHTRQLYEVVSPHETRFDNGQTFWIEASNDDGIVFRVEYPDQVDATSSSEGWFNYRFFCDQVSCAYRYPGTERIGTLRAILPELNWATSHRVKSQEAPEPIDAVSIGYLAFMAGNHPCAMPILSDRSELVIEFGAGEQEERIRTTYAVLNAIKFIEGRRLKPVLTIEHGHDGKLLTVWSQNISANAVYPPIAATLNSRDNEELLTKATSVFADERYSNIVTALNLLWDTADGDFRLQCAQATQALEGIATTICGTLEEEVAAQDYVKRLFEVLQKDENKPIREDALWDRLVGAIKIIQRPNQRTYIERAAALTGVIVSEGEIEAWQKLRHALGHGDYDRAFRNKETGQLILDHSKLALVINAINKLILGLMEYEGLFTDYAAENWMPKRLKRKN